MRLVGMAHCADFDEVDRVVEALSEIPGAEVTTIGLEVSVVYNPNGTERVLKAAAIIGDITEVLETVKTHGVSVLSEKG